LSKEEGATAKNKTYHRFQKMNEKKRWQQTRVIELKVASLQQ